MSALRARYINLLKRSISGRLHEPRTGPGAISLTQAKGLLQEANQIFKPYLAASGHTVESFLLGDSPLAIASFPEQLCVSLNGMHCNQTADTMSNSASIDNLHYCVEQVIANEVPGDLIETGIWKGGLTVLMRGILKAHDVTDRLVWAADSFEGLPKPDPRHTLADAIWYHLFEPLDGLRISYEFVQGVFEKYDLLDDQVRFLRGWFADTLPAAPIDRLALMRLDGDWYDSTRLALEVLYPKLSPGGFIIIDDYGLPFGCRRAVDEYREAFSIREPIQWANSQVAFWQRSLSVDSSANN